MKHKYETSELVDLPDVRYGSTADVTLLNFDVRFTPESCRGWRRPARPRGSRADIDCVS